MIMKVIPIMSGNSTARTMMKVVIMTCGGNVTMGWAVVVMIPVVKMTMLLYPTTITI